ncbi:MAG: Ig-like domain-containing protein [Myxococcota bacterium]|nr:Ig-like domain-containing protein [Myxococcota bacterium]
MPSERQRLYPAGRRDPSAVRDRSQHGLTASLLLALTLIVGGCLPEESDDPDLNGDGIVNILDASLVGSCQGFDPAESCGCRRADPDHDGVIDQTDLDYVLGAFGESGFPVEPADETPPVLTIDRPADGAVVEAASVVIEGRSDERPFAVRVNGLPAELVGAMSFRAEVPLPTGTEEQEIEVVVTDLACNETRTTLRVARSASDRFPPLVTLEAPTQVQPSEVIRATARVVDDRGVVETRFFVDGLLVSTATEEPFELAYNAPAGASARVEIRSVAADAAGNSGEATARVAVVEAPDTTAPVIEAIVLPTSAAAGAEVTARIVVRDDRGVAEVRLARNGEPAGSKALSPYEIPFVVPSTALPGDTIAVDVEASDTSGNTASERATLLVAAEADDEPPDPVGIQAPAELVGGRAVRLTASALDPGGVLAVEFLVDGVPLGRDADPPYEQTFRVPDGAPIDSIFSFVARARDFAGNEADSPAAVARVAAAGRGAVAGEVYDDRSGLPLPDVRVRLLEEGGSPVEPARETVSDAQGRYAFALAEGIASLAFALPGHTGAWRRVAIEADAVSTPLDVRLTPLAPSQLVGALGGALPVANAGVTLEVGVGAFASAAPVTLTPLGGQGLPSPLPFGWSPVRSLHVDAGGAEPGAGAFTARFEELDDPASLLVAQWLEESGDWSRLDASLEAGSLVVPLPGTATLALARADAQPAAPPTPDVGTALEGVASAALAEAAEAELLPSPTVLFFQPDARAQVTARLSSPSPLPSGTPIEVALTERYERSDGAGLAPEPRRQDLLLYQKPSGFEAAFPASPSRSFDPTLLRGGSIHLAARRLAEGDGSALVGSSGGTVSSPDGAAVVVPPGALAEPAAVSVRNLPDAPDPLVGSPRLATVATVQVDFAGSALQVSAAVRAPLAEPLPPGTRVLALLPVEVEGVTRLELVGVASVDGTSVDPTSIEVGGGAAGLPLPGVRGGGRVVFARALEPLGFLTGAVDVAGTPPEAALVESDSLPIVSLVDASDPLYVLAAPLGPAVAEGRSLTDGSRGASDAVLTEADAIASLDLTLTGSRPQVAGVTPEDGATGVAPGSAVSVVFSRPMDPASVDPSSFQLSSDSGPVAGEAVLAADGVTAVFRADRPLDDGTRYQVSVAATLRDRFGNALLGNQPDGSFASAFDTVDTTPPPRPDAGRITVSIPEDGTSTVDAGPGTVEPEALVSVTDETTGITRSVLAGADGSFSLTIAASIDSHLRLLVVDAAGNETRVEELALGTPDRRVIGPEGGVLELPTGETVTFPAKAFVGNAVVKVSRGPLLANVPEGLRQAGPSLLFEVGEVEVNLPARLRVYSPQVPGFEFVQTSWPYIIDQALAVPAFLHPGGEIELVAESTLEDGRVATATLRIPVAATPDPTRREVRDDQINPIFDFEVPTRVAPGESVPVVVTTSDADLVITVPAPQGVTSVGQAFLAASSTVNGVETLSVIDIVELVERPDGSRVFRNNLLPAAAPLAMIASAGALTAPFAASVLFSDEFIAYEFAYGRFVNEAISNESDVSRAIFGAGVLAGSTVFKGFVAAEFARRRAAGILTRPGQPLDITVIDTDTNQVIEGAAVQVAPEGGFDIVTIDLSDDREGPTIAAVSACPSEEIGWTDAFDLEFSEPVGWSTTNATTITLSPTDGSGPIPTRIAFLNDNRKFLRIEPLGSLRPGTRYTLTLSDEIRDLAGNPLRAPYSIEFETQPFRVDTGATTDIAFLDPLDIEVAGEKVYVLGSVGLGRYGVPESGPFLPDGDLLGGRLATSSGAIAYLDDVRFTGADGILREGDFLMTVTGGIEEHDRMRILDVTDGRFEILDRMLFDFPQSEVQNFLELGSRYRVPDNLNGVPKLYGVARDIEVFGSQAAFVATLGVGIQSFVVPNVLGNGDFILRSKAFGPTHPLDPQLYDASFGDFAPPIGFETCPTIDFEPPLPPGVSEDTELCEPGTTSILDLALLKGELVATGRIPFQIFDATDLRPLRKVTLPGTLRAHNVTTLEGYVADLDGDGNTGTFEENDSDPLSALDEIFDLALVGAGSSGLYVVDMSKHHAGTPFVMAHIQDPDFSAFEILPFDNDRKLAVVDRIHRGIQLIDLRVPCGIDGKPVTPLCTAPPGPFPTPDETAAALNNPTSVYVADRNGDGRDDRLIDRAGSLGSVLAMDLHPDPGRLVFATSEHLRTLTLPLTTFCTEEAPAADAGPDQMVQAPPVGSTLTVTLDASGSVDPEGEALAFSWTQVSGPGIAGPGVAFVLNDPGSATPSFQVGPTSLPFEAEFTVRVSDAVLFHEDTVKLTVTASP